MSEPKHGDWVTMTLYSDGFSRTSEVNEDGSYVGSGAVAQGRGEIIRVIPRTSYPVTRITAGETVTRYFTNYAEASAYRDGIEETK